MFLVANIEIIFETAKKKEEKKTKDSCSHV
jgi:hypothetical protein